MKRNILLACALTAAIGSLSLSGCVVVPARQAAYYDGEVVNVAPPAPENEFYGEPPVAGYVWLGGYWNWAGGRHTWVGGHWEAPRAGYHWVPHTWVRQGAGWHLNQGHWDRHR